MLKYNLKHWGMKYKILNLHHSLFILSFFSSMTYWGFICLLQIYMHNRQDITETNLKPALLEGKDNPALWLLILTTQLF